MTNADAADSTPTRKLLAGRGMKGRIAAASLALLGIGAWLTPRPPQIPAPLSAPQERAAPLLEEQVLLREANRPFPDVQDLAARVRDHTVAIAAPAAVERPTRNDYAEPATRPPHAAGFGAFVADTYVLAHSASLDGRSAVRISTADGRAAEARLVVYEPSTGLVLLHTEPLGRPSVMPPNGAPAPGTLAVAVGHREGRDVVVPVFVTSVEADRYTITHLDNGQRRGIPIYSLEGQLVAIAAPDGAEVIGIPAGDAAARLMARAAAGERGSSIGVALQEPAGGLARIFGDAGAVITDIVEGGPADQAGLQAGDVLLAVGDVEVDSVDTARRALSAREIDTSVTLRIARDRRARAVEVVPALAYEVAALADARPDDATRGLEAGVLLPAAVLEAEGIPGSARVISINGRPVSSLAQARRDLRPGPNPALLLLRDGNNQFFAAVGPTQ